MHLSVLPIALFIFGFALINSLRLPLPKKKNSTRNRQGNKAQSLYIKLQPKALPHTDNQKTARTARLIPTTLQPTTTASQVAATKLWPVSSRTYMYKHLHLCIPVRVLEQQSAQNRISASATRPHLGHHRPGHRKAATRANRMEG